MRRALVVGAQINGLTGVDNDAQQVGSFLSTQEFEVTLATGHRATRHSLLGLLSKLTAATYGDDIVVVYYAGPGHLLVDLDTANRQRPVLAISTTDHADTTQDDYRGLTYWELTLLLTQLASKTRNVTTILDCSHTAQLSRFHAIPGARARAIADPVAVALSSHVEQLHRIYQSQEIELFTPFTSLDVVQLAACGPAESAFEYVNTAGHRTGIFTEALLESLVETGDAPVAWVTLASTIRQRVRQKFPYQQPVCVGPINRVVFSLTEVRNPEQGPQLADVDDEDVPARVGQRNIMVPDRSLGEVPDARYRVKHCLAIGIDRYQDRPRLSHAVHDARGVATALEKRYGFEVRIVLDEEATRVRILNAINADLRSVVQADDLVVVFFAGHGHTLRHANGQLGYIVPVDAREADREAGMISVEEVRAMLDSLPNRHLLLIFDSCFSGIATVRAAPDTQWSLARNARWALTAGGADETVLDGGWQNHSTFTGLLLRELDGAPPGEALSTATVFGKLHHEVSALAKLQGAQQTPAFGALPGHAGGDIQLIPIGQAPFAVPISVEASPLIAAYSSEFPQTGHTVRSSSPTQERLKAYDEPVELSRAEASLFAAHGRQWAIIIGTNPSMTRRMHDQAGVTISTEFFDACDVLDWFLNPDVFGPLPSGQLFFLGNSDASAARVDTAMERVHRNVGPNDSVLFYFSGHVTTFSKPGEFLLHDAFAGQSWGAYDASTPGLLPVDDLIDWMNALACPKVVAVLDPGGAATFDASRRLQRGRYVLASDGSLTIGRNGFVTWYVRRALQRLGPRTSLRTLYEILRLADVAVNASRPLGIYLRAGSSGLPDERTRESSRPRRWPLPMSR